MAHRASGSTTVKYIMKQSSITIRISEIRAAYLKDQSSGGYICWTIVRMPPSDTPSDFWAALENVTAGVKKACFHYLKGVKNADGTPLLIMDQPSDYIGDSLSCWLNLECEETFQNTKVPKWMEGDNHRILRMYVLDKILEIDPDAVIEVEGFDMGDYQWNDFIKMEYTTIMKKHSGFTVKIQDVLQHYMDQEETNFICTSMINFKKFYGLNLNHLQEAISLAMKQKVFNELEGMVYPGTSTPILRKDEDMYDMCVLSAWVNPPPSVVTNAVIDAYAPNTFFTDPLRVFILDKFLQLNSDSELHVGEFEMPDGVELKNALYIPVQVK